MATVLRACAFAVAATAVATGACSDASQPGLPTTPAPMISTPDPGPPPASRWERVLNRLDSARQAAYRAGDPARLADVYLPGSAVLRRDRRTLMAYERRGVRLRGVRLEIHSVDVRQREGRSVRLRVVDQLSRPTAHTAAGPILLPQDLPTRRIVVLHRVTGGWRIATVLRLAG